MKRILLVWELGCGLGQISRLLSIGRELKKRGHKVIFIVRHLHHNNLGKMMYDEGFDWFQAPFYSGTLQVSTPRFNSYTHVVQNACCQNENLLLSQVKAWRLLYDQIKPDVIVLDNSPTAIIAAHGLDARRIIIGNHYNIPPDQYPLPNIKQWINISEHQLKQDEDFVVGIINKVFEITDQPAISAIRDIYSQNKKAYLTFKELDYYINGLFENEYMGVLPSPYDELPVWQSGHSNKVFIYLQPWGFVPIIFEILQKMKCQVLALISSHWQPGVSDQIKNFHGKNIHLGYKQFSITKVVQECDAVICHSGHDTVCHTLLAGKPLLLLPNNLDKNLSAKKVEEMGAGLSKDPNNEFNDFEKKMEAILEDEAYTRNAEKFGDKYKDINLVESLNKVIKLVERSLY